MKRVFGLILVYACLAASAVFAAANLANLSAGDRKQVNEWMAQRAEAMTGSHKLEAEVNQAWSDTAYSSPEVDALRARYRDLQQELLKTQREIQKRVLEVPEVQAKVRKLEESKKKEQELTRKIAEITDEK